MSRFLRSRPAEGDCLGRTSDGFSSNPMFLHAFDDVCRRTSSDSRGDRLASSGRESRLLQEQDALPDGEQPVPSLHSSGDLLSLSRSKRSRQGRTKVRRHSSPNRTSSFSGI